MKGWIIRSLAALLVTMGLMLGQVAPASATPRATLKAAAKAVAYEQVRGGNYAKYKALYPSELNWSNDGCSVPSYVVAASPALAGVLAVYGEVFEASCDRHDFGYRNFGKNTTTPGVHPKFSPTRATKDKIDTRFYKNMKKQCDSAFPGVIKTPLRLACKAGAKTFYKAVSHFADEAFFG